MYLPTVHVPLNLDEFGLGDLDGIDEEASYRVALDLLRDYFDERVPQYNVIVVPGAIGEQPSWHGLTWFAVEYPESDFAEDAEGKSPFDLAWEESGDYLLTRIAEWVVVS